MSRQKIYIKEDSKEKAIRKIEQTISETAKKVLNETKWIGPNDEPIDGPDYDSIDNQSQNNLPPIDRYHPDYWYYRQEEEPYDPTYDEGYLDDYSVNNDNEFKDDLDDWGIEENKQYNKNRNMKQTIKLRESELKRMIAESVKSVINELDWRTYASAADKRYEQGREEDGDKLINASNKAAMKLAKQDISRYARENDSWYGNRSKYVKGKGWQNESFNRKINRIVSECLKRNLR